MKQTILMVHNYYQIPGGEDTVVANEKKMLEDNGHKVVLYARNNNELKNMGVLRKLLLPFTTIYNPKTASDIKRIINEEKIDIVHVHNTLNLISPAVYYVALKMKKPVVQTVHNFRLLCPRATFYRDGHICEDCVSKGLGCAIKNKCYRDSFLQTLVCVMSTKIHRWTGIYGKISYICLTEFNKEKLLNLKDVKEERVFVKPNFANKRSEVKTERKEQYVFVGRLDKLKGIELLLQAWKEMGENAPKLIICGTGPMEDWCKDYVKENNLNVEMRGFIPNSEAVEIIGESKALVLPTQWYEGFPMIIAEAYSVAKPVLCTDIGNASAIVEHDNTGYKFENNVFSLKSAVRALDDSKKYERNINTAYEKLYTEQANYRIMKKIYDVMVN